MSLTQSGSLGGSGTPTVLTDQANGMLLINNGSTPQEAQRPIQELGILAPNLIDPNADYYDVWDASAGRMVRTLAHRASQTNYLADGLNNTRAGSLGNTTTSIYAAWDHIHPITALTLPALPNCVVTGSGGALVSQTLNRQRATEETLTYVIQVRTSNTAATAWMRITPPTLVGYYLSSFTNYTYDPSAANLAPFYGTHPTFVWTGTILYVRPRAVNLDLYHNITLTYTLN